MIKYNNTGYSLILRYLNRNSKNRLSLCDSLYPTFTICNNCRCSGSGSDLCNWWSSVRKLVK